MLCNFQLHKQKIEDSLADKDQMERLLQEGEFRVKYPEGFDSGPNLTLQE